MFCVISVFFVANCQDKLGFNINIPKDDYQILMILKQIEAQADCRFSYNAEIINISDVKHFEANNKSVKQCLDEIFENKLKYKSSGKYIVLLPNENYNKNQKVVIKGKITDQNNQPIPFASIYDINNQYATITNGNGEFEMQVETQEQVNAITLTKVGYVDTVIVCSPRLCGNLDAKLNKDQLKYPVYTSTENKSFVEDLNLVKYILPVKTYLNSVNLQTIQDTSKFQFSILPFLSTNLAKQGVLYNNLSLNLLIGYSKGTKGVEIAGLINIDKENVEGVQIAGLGNIVGRNVQGAQISGYANFNLGALDGIQVSSIINYSNKQSQGVQISGFMNAVNNNFEGVQVAGFANGISGSLNGAQVAGFTNFSYKNFQGAQVSGFANIILGNSDAVQVSGFGNMCLDTCIGAQIAGFTNIAKVSNVQISSFANFAHYHNGFQLAMFNLCDSSDGVSFGLLSFVIRGLHKFIISTDDFSLLNLTFVSGNNNLYNVYSLHYSPNTQNIWGYAMGWGTKLRFTNWLYLNNELVFNSMNYNTLIDFTPFNYTSLTEQLEFRLFRKISIYLGPKIYYSQNIYSKNKEIIDFLNTRYNYTIFQSINNDEFKKLWLGWTFGISL